jgi:hypothetical protein
MSWKWGRVKIAADYAARVWIETRLKRALETGRNLAPQVVAQFGRQIGCLRKPDAALCKGFPEERAFES